MMPAVGQANSCQKANMKGSTTMFAYGKNIKWTKIPTPKPDATPTRVLPSNIISHTQIFEEICFAINNMIRLTAVARIGVITTTSIQNRVSSSIASVPQVCFSDIQMPIKRARITLRKRQDRFSTILTDQSLHSTDFRPQYPNRDHGQAYNLRVFSSLPENPDQSLSIDVTR